MSSNIGSRFEFNYTLDGTGWATLFIRWENKQTHLDVSYMNNSLDELLSATNMLLDNTIKEASVLIVEEPDECLFMLQKLAGGELQIDIRRYDSAIAREMHMDEAYELCFTAIAPLDAFAGRLYTAVTRILAEYGIKGYQKLWISHEFPMEQYLRLKNLIKE